MIRFIYMKKLILIFALLFSTASFAEWEPISFDENGIFYIDSDRIRNHDGYVYYWMMVAHKKQELGNMSSSAYVQGDCKLFRFKRLTYYFHENPNATGEVLGKIDTPDKEWTYPLPGSIAEAELKKVCSI